MSSQRPAGDTYGPWTKSSRSGFSGDCIEVAGLTGDTIHVRDSKNPNGPVLRFVASGWNAFIGGVNDGRFDREPRI